MMNNNALIIFQSIRTGLDNIEIIYNFLKFVTKTTINEEVIIRMDNIFLFIT